MNTQKSQMVSIPAVGRVPAFDLDTENRAQVANLVKRFNSYVKLSKSAWERRQDSRLTPAQYRALENREMRMGENAEMLLRPLGIKCDWPGLYPSFTVNGYCEHTTEAAVLSAIGKPRNCFRLKSEREAKGI